MLYFYHMFAIAHYHALGACQAMGGFWVMLFGTQKGIACIFFASRYSWAARKNITHTGG
jgi:hypothetical protein